MAASTLPVRNPRTGKWDHEIPVTSTEDIASSEGSVDSQIENRSGENVVDQVADPVAKQLQIDQGSFSTSDKIAYLQSEIDLIFESHIELSQKLRVLARKIDLEEQIAFEESVTRKELEQELQIRDKLLARINTPPATEAGSSSIRVKMLTQPTTPTQVAPVLLWHLSVGSLMGGGLLGLISMFVLLVGFED